MKHEVHFDKEIQTIVFRAHGEFNAEDALVISTQMQDIIEQNGDCYLFVDLRDSPPTLDKEVRRALKGPSHGKGLIKMAMITDNPSVRMMGKIVTSIMGKGKDTRFFSDETQAWEWIRSETGSHAKRR